MKTVTTQPVLTCVTRLVRRTSRFLKRAALCWLNCGNLQKVIPHSWHSTPMMPNGYQGLVTGLSVLPLHEHDGVNTALVRWAPNTQFSRHVHVGGEEILVLEGLFCDEYGHYPTGSWLRNPRYSSHTPFTLEEGALIYVKVGHMGADLMGYRFIRQLNN